MQADDIESLLAAIAALDAQRATLGDAAGDGRATSMLEQLFADAQARAAELTDEADRRRLIQAPPGFREIVAAHTRRGPPGAAA